MFYFQAKHFPEEDTPDPSFSSDKYSYPIPSKSLLLERIPQRLQSYVDRADLYY